MFTKKYVTIKKDVRRKFTQKIFNFYTQSWNMFGYIKLKRVLKCKLTIKTCFKV